MVESQALKFSIAARRIGAVARREGLKNIPAWRSPPRNPEATRSIRWLDDRGTAVVSIRLAGRTADQVVEDMIDGMLAVNARKGDRELKRIFREGIGGVFGATDAVEADAPDDEPESDPNEKPF